MGYRRRIIDQTLDDVFPHLAAVSLEGAKGVGKTATASQRATTTFSLSRPTEREALAADPDRIMRVTPPVLLDEWQLEPETWDRIRTAVDDDDTGGRFLLTGSAGVAPGVRIHSGAGRIVRLRLRPLAFSEREIALPTVSLRDLLNDDGAEIGGDSDIDLEDYTDEILRSGFPGIRNLPERARNLQLDSYLTRIVDHELPDNGAVVRRPAALTAWMRAYGAATSTPASYTTILDAATAGEAEKPARGTIDAYREHLARLFVLDPVPAWTPGFNPLKRLTQTPKHHLVDPSLAARLTKTGKNSLLRGDGKRVGDARGTWLGALFESLASQSVRVYAEAADATLGHVRTKDNVREIDLIVEGDDGRVVALEVTLAPTVGDRDVRHLHWLRDRIGDRLANRVIITTGSHAYRRHDGVAVVPLALLGP